MSGKCRNPTAIWASALSRAALPGGSILATEVVDVKGDEPAGDCLPTTPAPLAQQRHKRVHRHGTRRAPQTGRTSWVVRVQSGARPPLPPLVRCRTPPDYPELRGAPVAA